MGCKIVVSYICSMRTGEIIDIFEDSHRFSHNESLEEWLLYAPGNTRENWSRSFTIVEIVDKTKDDIIYLKSKTNEVGDYYFETPVSGEPAFTALNTFGKIVCDFATANIYLRSRI